MARRAEELRVERVFERSRLEKDLRAGAYEMLIPVRRVALRGAKKERATTCG